jgi:hypothetical protein
MCHTYFGRIELNATVLFLRIQIFIVLHLYAADLRRTFADSYRIGVRIGAAFNAGRYAATLWESGKERGGLALA